MTMDFNTAPHDPRELYLDLMMRCLINWVYADRETGLLSGLKMEPEARLEGREWPGFAHTMIGLRRLLNIRECVETALRDRVAGDLLEAGIWRGGATIFMRALLQAHQVTDRNVWAIDSFEGVPPPNIKKYAQDKGMVLHKFPQLAVKIEEVQANFARYGLLDSQVRLLKGWFHAILPGAAIPNLAVLRLDGDLYQSTFDGLTYLYPKVSPGGFVIVDDYNSIGACRQAVDDYRAANEITESLIGVDWSGAYWRRRG